ncbi:DeoR/GlpR family DNA-binding transcription regulator [Treponema sp.]
MSEEKGRQKVNNYRHRKILEILYEKGSVLSEELAEIFSVSRITIRRDLDALAAAKLLERTHGGAVIGASPRHEAIFAEKDSLCKREKQTIGRYVASLIEENDTVFLNAGSTTLEVLRNLKDKKVKVITNNAASITVDLDSGVELIVLGGEYRRDSQSYYGDIALLGIKSIYSSVTVLGINGISARKGLTSAVYQETSINRAMIDNSSGKVIVVADHSKMNCVSSFLTCGFDKIDMIATDWQCPEPFVQELRGMGVKVEIAHEET